jgi:hypothetical protein
VQAGQISSSWGTNERPQNDVTQSKCVTNVRCRGMRAEAEQPDSHPQAVLKKTMWERVQPSPRPDIAPESSAAYRGKATVCQTDPSLAERQTSQPPSITVHILSRACPKSCAETRSAPARRALGGGFGAAFAALPLPFAAGGGSVELPAPVDDAATMIGGGTHSPPEALPTAASSGSGMSLAVAGRCQKWSMSWHQVASSSAESLATPALQSRGAESGLRY